MNNRRSASVGALPVEKKHFVSRNESSSGALLDVRCACQYFQCESLLPDKVNPGESRPNSKLGFHSDIDHGDHAHFDNVSNRSFNMMGSGRPPEFDRMSTGSFGGRIQGLDGRGLVVRSISDAKEPEMGSGMMAGFRGRQMSIGGASSGSFGGRDPDAVSIRSGISLRRISRSPSRADLFVADLNIPTPHMQGIPKFNIVAPTPIPGAPGSTGPPDFSTYDRKSRPRWKEVNKENLSRVQGRVLPQNKPIDVSQYKENNISPKSRNEPMDIDIIEAVVDVKDNIRIDRMSPPLEENVPDLSPVVENETRIEISDFAPQLELRSIEEILADDKTSASQLKRHHAYDRDISPDYSKKQFMQRDSPTGGGQSFQRGTSPAINGRQYGLPPTGTQSFQRAYSQEPMEGHYNSFNQSVHQSFQKTSSPAPNGAQSMDGRQFMQYGSPQRASSPPPSQNQYTDVRQFTQPIEIGGPSGSQSFQRASSPAPNSTQQYSSATSQSFQRAQSPPPNLPQKYSSGPSVSQSFQRASSQPPNESKHTDARQFMQYGSGASGSQSFQRASSPQPKSTNDDYKSYQRASSPTPADTLFQRGTSPTPTGIQQMETSRSIQRASSPVPAGLHQRQSDEFHMDTNQINRRAISPGPSSMSQSFQRASSPTPIGKNQTPQKQTSGVQNMDTNQTYQRASSPSPMGVNQSFGRATTPFQQASTATSVITQNVDKPHEEKPSYSSRFMSMFHSKTPDDHTMPSQNNHLPQPEKQKLTIAQHLHIGRERTPSPGKQLKHEHSPTPSRIMSVFKRDNHAQHATAMTVVEGTHLTNASIRKGPEEKQHTIKVTETFSLKVDEMDQYSNHPPKSSSPVRQSRPYASTEQLGLTQDRISELTDLYGDHEPFAPVVVPSAQSSQIQLQAGDRAQYMSASQADLRATRRYASHEHIQQPQAEARFGSNRKLISVPIAVPSDFYDTEMTSPEFFHLEHEDHPNYSPASRPNLIKAPSEQRIAQSKLLQRKVHCSDRTQSQDRSAAFDRSSEIDTLSVSTRSMTKTVSFNFGDRDSRLGQHEKMVSSNSHLDKGPWLERTYFSRDHEYEPIGEPASKTESKPTVESVLTKEPSPAPPTQEIPKFEISQPTTEAASPSTKSDELKEAEDMQKDLEDRYFTSAATTSQLDVEISPVDSSALEEEPAKDIRKKSFMASAQDRTRKMQAGLKNQAGKIKTKFRSPKKVPSGSPKAKDRKRFKAPEFSKIKMPEIKRPDLSGFKRPEFTKFSKPDMSKFKLPDKFSSLKLNRSKSFKESTDIDETTVSGTTPESTSPNTAASPKKPKFDFSFGTYPRAFRKKSKPQETESTVDEPSLVLSTETQPSAESSSTPQGDRGPGPVRSRWADKFSDVSYNDSEGSRYRRYGSEQESSFDRESSMERRMKDVLDENAKEEAELAMLGVVEQKQFADYDEENRVIHEISKTREKEFKRRPMIHQDSDLVSEEGRDIGWTEKEAQKIQILRKAELEAEQHFKYLSEKISNQDTQSTASSKKMVFEEIDDDEFFLRKKGLSQEFNIINQRFLDPTMEAAFSNSPNALECIGYQSGSVNGSIDRMDYGYDVPPPKPRRLSHQQHQRHNDSENASQIDEFADDISLSQAGSEYLKHAAPSRPLRKSRFKNSQDISIGGTPSVQFDEEDYTDRGNRVIHHEYDEEKENMLNESPMPVPQAPRRRRKQLRDSVDKDSYVNGFGGRSVSNSYLKEDNKPEEVIVYRTEHEYKIPLATAENYTDSSTTPRKSRSLSRIGGDEDDRTSHGADSIAMRDYPDLDDEEIHEKYIIEMSENDGYAVVRKENIPKPTPPARRKKFSRSPGERFATMPHMRKGSPSVPDQQSSARNYSTVGRPTPPRRRSALSLGADSQKDFGSEDFNEYEVPELDDRTESPRNLQSGDIINRMKYRPLPPPPRPPREKRHNQKDRHGEDDDEFDSRDDQDDRDGGGERIIFDDFHEHSSDDYNLQQSLDKEVEVSTQTDPLPDDFVCEEFEITDDMKIIEPRRTKTLDEILKEEEEADLERAKQIEEEVLMRGIQRFREANQRSASEKSRASSQAKSLSRPQTPSAILIEKRVPTPVPNANGQTVLEASLIVQPIDDLDLEEELLRREGLYDGSHSKSDGESRNRDEETGHGSDEENANIGEVEGSYTHSTDAESHQHDEEEQRLEEERLLVQRLLDEEEEEQRLLERIRNEMRLQEEEERRLDELERERTLQHEEEERTQRLLEEEENKRILQEKEELKQRLLDYMNKEQQRLNESSDDEKITRLKVEDSYELKSDISEEKEVSPPPSPTVSVSPLPPPEEQMVLDHQNEPMMSQEEEPTQSQKEPLLYEQPQPQPDEEPSIPPPMAPRRKRSSGAALVEDPTDLLPVATEQQPTTTPFTGVMPSHLALADLEVERLRVHALQAGHVMVSHLHGTHIQADELECRSGNLVVNNIELPPGFIENIVERVRSSSREHSQVATQTIAEAKTQTDDDSIPAPPLPRRHSDQPPIRPPPPQRENLIYPSEYIRANEVPTLPRGCALPAEYVHPIGFYNPRIPNEDAGEPTPPVYRRRRHHRRRDSSSEEDNQRHHSRSARPEPQTVSQAGRQFISACSLPLTNVINQLTNAVRPNNDNKQDQPQPRNISTVVVLFIIMTLTLLFYLLSGKNIHHHHWDYFNPPGNDGRLS